MTDGRVLAVGGSGDPGGVFAALSTAYEVHAEPLRTFHWTWLDTADWRLHQAGLALREERAGRRRELVLDGAGAPVAVPLTGIRWPARLDALPDSPLRDRLAGIVDSRALLPVAEVQARRIPLKLMDDIGKTRARVSVEQQRLLSPRRAALPLHVVVRALRGYDRDAQRCLDLLRPAMNAELTSIAPTDAAFAAAGHLPEPAAPPAVVTPDEPAVWPVARALGAAGAALAATREGVLADLDTEFLREFRAAARATIALIDVTGDLLTGRAAVRARRELAWLLEVTGPVAECDVALRELAGHGRLDLTGVAELDALRSAVASRRRTALRRLRQGMRSPRAVDWLGPWRSGLAGMLAADPIGPSAREAAVKLARSTYHDITGALEGPQPPDLPERVAALRGVLGAFGELYPEGPRRRLDGDAAAVLDAYADARELGTTGAHVLAVADTLPVPAVLAAGAVLDRLRAAADSAQLQAADRLRRFTGERTAARIEGLG